MNSLNPTSSSQRYIILDAIRGFALLGICLANYPEFSLYSFLPESLAASFPSFEADRILRYFLYIFVDGKFYSIFSILFGIGFSIILLNAKKKGADGIAFFYRRMIVLAIIGFLHLMFIWSGDIVLLYALIGMFLPLFLKLPDGKIIRIALVLLFIPALLDFAKDASSGSFDLAKPAVYAQNYVNSIYGINDGNFHTWLRDSQSYGQVFQFLIQGALVRVQEIVGGHRIFKVLALFLIGFCVGRNAIYANLASWKVLLKKLVIWGFAAGGPLSLLYAFSAMNGHLWGDGMHSLLYALSVVPMALAYMAGISLFFLVCPAHPAFKLFSYPGRLALSNYISQSVIGMFIFYGIGLGLGASLGLSRVELIALCVFAFQVCFSFVWLNFFNFGPLEWIWRMLTYGKFLPLKK